MPGTAIDANIRKDKIHFLFGEPPVQCSGGAGERTKSVDRSRTILFRKRKGYAKAGVRNELR